MKSLYLSIFLIFFLNFPNPVFAVLPMPIEGHIYLEGTNTIVIKAQCEDGLKVEGRFSKIDLSDQLLITPLNETTRIYARTPTDRTDSKTDEIFYEAPFVYGLFIGGSTYIGMRFGRLIGFKFKLKNIRQKIFQLVAAATGLLAGDHIVSSQPFDASLAFELACTLNDEDLLRTLNFKKLNRETMQK